jgi:hypothetical protein
MTSFTKKEDLAVRATTSAILAETFAQYLQHTNDNLQCMTKTQKQHKILHLTTREF